MKEFEKYWEENGGGVCGKEACKKYWRAAIGWALNHDECDPQGCQYLIDELEGGKNET